MAAKFEVTKIKKLIQSAKEWVLIGFLGVIVVVMLFLLAQGGKKAADSYVPEVAKSKPENIRFPEAGAKAVSKTLEGLKPFDNSDYKEKLLSRNLFDFRDVMTRYDFEKKINDKLKAAQSYFDQKYYDETIRLCDEILAQDSAREPAIQLKDKATKAKSTG
ncbi:MAG: hypothetical protein QME64_01400 [bacterium]|nr:hypothetical protein [bacterium]